MPSLQTTLLAALFTLSTLTAALPTPQLAGEGAALNSIFSSTDNGIGFGIKNAEDNLAANIASLKGSTGGATGGAAAAPAPAPPAPGPMPPKRARQLDKISNGFQDIGNAAGVGSSTSGLTTMLDDIDGQSTSGAANVGAEVGNLEESSMESLGKGIPRV